MRSGTKHLISCHCVLPQFRKMKNPIFHKFTVFSILENDKVISKIAKCNNCGVLHRIVDICKSEFIHGHEDSNNSIIMIDDLKILLPDKLVKILDSYSVDLATWENAQFLLEQKKWNSFLVLTQEELNDNIEGKLLRIIGENLYKIETFSRSSIVGE
jgi:hypothetical protein